MKVIRIRAMARKEALQIMRDPLSLAMAFLVPLFLLIIFGYAITFDIRDIDMIVLDRDNSALSRQLISAIQEAGYFAVVDRAEREQDIDDALDTGLAKVAIVVPVDFNRRIRNGRSAQLGVFIDGSDANTATITQAYIAGIVDQFIQRLGGRQIRLPLEVRSRVWYNPELKSRNFIIPGLIAVIMGIIVALLTSLTVSREWERGTMEQLIATPVRTPELIIGKLIPYFAIGFLDTVASVVMGTQLFHVPLRGSVALLLIISCIFLAGGLCMGILISIISRNQLLSSQMALLSTFLPSFLLSGFIFAISNMPRPLQIITLIVPARYFVEVLKGIFLKGVPFRLLVVETALLVVFGSVLFGLANRRFRKQVD
jgi:ABC-2 type transport system permease protein